MKNRNKTTAMITKNLIDINDLNMLNQNLASPIKNEEILKAQQECSYNNMQNSPKVIFMKLPMDQYSSNKNKEISNQNKTNHNFVEGYIQNLYKKSFGEKKNTNNTKKIDETTNVMNHRQSSKKIIKNQEPDQQTKKEISNKKIEYSNFLKHQFGNFFPVIIQLIKYFLEGKKRESSYNSQSELKIKYQNSIKELENLDILIAKEKFEKDNIDKLDIQNFIKNQQRRINLSPTLKNNLVY